MRVLHTKGEFPAQHHHSAVPEYMNNDLIGLVSGKHGCRVPSVVTFTFVQHHRSVVTQAFEDRHTC